MGILLPAKVQEVSPVYIYFLLQRCRRFRQSTYTSSCKGAGGFASLHILPPAKVQEASPVYLSFLLQRCRRLRQCTYPSSCKGAGGFASLHIFLLQRYRRP